jgi:hypothetical protein
MRPFRLMRVAAEAEGVRLRGFVRRVVARIILGMIALLFGLGVIVFAHMAAWYWLRTGLDQTFLTTTAILGGVDLIVAVILGLFATRSTPSRVEVEALDVRRKAIEAIGSTLSLTRLIIPLMRIVANLRRRKQD